MFKPLKTLIVAGGLALGLSGFSATTAQAGQSLLTFGGPGYSVSIGNGVRPARHWNRDRGFAARGICNPRRALRKARGQGIRNAHIRRIGPNRVVVVGRSRGERVVMGMGRHSSCPVQFVRVQDDYRYGRIDRRGHNGGRFFSNR